MLQLNPVSRVAARYCGHFRPRRSSISAMFRRGSPAANIVVFCTIGISAAQCEPVHTCHSPPMLFIRESRCLVPANSFAEYAPEPNPATGKKDVVWFALDDDRLLFAFGGLWTEFKGRISSTAS